MMVRTPPLSKPEEEAVMQTHDNVAAQATSSATVAQGDTVSTNETVNTNPLPTLLEMNELNNPQSKIIPHSPGGPLGCASQRQALSAQARGRDDQTSSGEISVTAAGPPSILKSNKN